MSSEQCLSQCWGACGPRGHLAKVHCQVESRELGTCPCAALVRLEDRRRLVLSGPCRLREATEGWKWVGPWATWTALSNELNLNLRSPRRRAMDRR